MNSFLKSLYYQFLTLWRDKIGFFWYFLFPLFLATIMGVTFQHFEQKESPVIRLAIEETLQEAPSLKESLPFKVTLLDQKVAHQALKKGKLDAFLNKHSILEVKEKGIPSSIIKNVLDEYKQVQSAQLDWRKVGQNHRQTYREEETIPVGLLQTILTSILFMQCLYVAFSSRELSNQLWDKNSAVRMRLLLSPIKKIPYLLSGLFTSLIFNFIVIGLFLAYIYTAFHIALIKNIPYSLLVLFLLNLFGALLGVSISLVLAKRSENIKSTLCLVIILLFSQTSGMFGTDFLNMIHEKLHFWEYLNPLLAAQKFYGSINYVGNSYFRNEFFTSISIWLILLLTISIYCIKGEHRHDH